MRALSVPPNLWGKSYMLLQPSRPVLVTSLGEDGATHVAPFGWVTPVSAEPPMIGLALLTKPKKQHTLVNIERSGEFVVNVPGLELAEGLVRCSYQVRPGQKKFALSGFDALPSVKVKPDSVAGCRAQLECRVLSVTPTGDHSLVIAEVIEARYDPEAFAASLALKVDKSMPCIHLNNYRTDDGQAHVFLDSAGVRLVEVPYEPGGDSEIEPEKS